MIEAFSSTGGELARILAVVVFGIIALLIGRDAKRREMNPPASWGVGVFVVLMSGAVIGEWLGAILAGAIGIGFYFYVRETGPIERPF